MNNVKHYVLGGVSRIVINGKPVNIGDDALEMVGVQDFPVCQGRPCQHGGKCTPAYTAEGFLCTCTEGYSGTHCQLTGEHCYPGR